MLESTADVNRLFHALADGTRRELIQRLSRGSATVSELAKPLPISLAAVVQHVQVLEDCGVVRTRKVGRVRTCELDAGGLLRAERWIAARRMLWEGRLDRLGALLEADASSGHRADSSREAGSSPRRKRGGPRSKTEREGT
jgi:DNA-binding transcriptional ArsR family regulator